MRNLVYTLLEQGRAITGQVDAHERQQIVRALVIGALVWAVVYPLKLLVHGGFHALLHILSQVPVVALVLIPLVIGALLTAALSRGAGEVRFLDDDKKVHTLPLVEGDGLERAISMYFASEPGLDTTLLAQEEGVQARWKLPTWRLAFRKWCATLCTLTTGGSGGLEASVSLIGESLAAALFKPRTGRISTFPGRVRPVRKAWAWWSLSREDELQAAQLCGIAAAIATLLGAPFAGAFFAVEVMYRRRPIIDKLIFALVSALVAFFLTDMADPTHNDVFAVGEFIRPPIHSLRYFGVLALAAVALSFVAQGFRLLRTRMDGFFHKRFENPWLRHATGALATGAVVLLVWPVLVFWAPPGDWNPAAIVLGPGENMVNLAIAGDITWGIALLALVAKLIATLTTITSGGSAGLLFPTMFFGAMVAAGCADLFGYAQPVVILAPALCASLVSIVNVPLAAILFTVEVFGASYMVPAMVALVVASVFAHDISIYKAQRETFDDRQILPGFSVRKVPVPAEWNGWSIAGMRVRARFGVNVIGVVPRGESGLDEAAPLLNPPADRPLQTGEKLIVLGPDGKLEAFEQHRDDVVRASMYPALPEHLRAPPRDETPPN